MAGASDAQRARLVEAITRGDRAKTILALVEQLEAAMAEFDGEPAKPPIATLPERQCAVCGGPFVPAPKRGGIPQRYCSPTCRNTANTRARPKGRRGRRQRPNGGGEPAPAEPAGGLAAHHFKLSKRAHQVARGQMPDQGADHREFPEAGARCVCDRGVISCFGEDLAILARAPAAPSNGPALHACMRSA
jgi:hypothetical protein